MKPTALSRNPFLGEGVDLPGQQVLKLADVGLDVPPLLLFVASPFSTS